MSTTLILPGADQPENDPEAIRDRLQAPAFEPLFLASYFAAGALSMPLWVRAVARFGLARAWAAGMVLAIVTFAWAALLGSGDVLAYTVVCVASGIALGADLTLPGALLAGVIQRAGHGQRLEGAYFGCGISPPSSTWRLPPVLRCRCSAPSATRPAARTPKRCAR